MSGLSLYQPASNGQPLTLRNGGVVTIGSSAAQSQLQAVSQSQAVAGAQLTAASSNWCSIGLLSALASGTASVAMIGDSNTECVGSTARQYGWPDRLAASLRSRVLSGAGDTGLGYVGAAQWYGPSNPTAAGSVVNGSGGLDGRAVQIANGKTLTWPAAQATTITLYYTSSFFARGTADVLIDGAKVASIDASQGAQQMPAQTKTFTVPAGSHTLAVQCTSGTFQAEGAFFSTAPTGLAVWAAGRSGSKAMDWAEDNFWSATLPITKAQLVIIGLGGNDQGGNWGTPISGAQFGQSLLQMTHQIRAQLPNAGILVMVGAPRLVDIEAGQSPAFNATFVQGAVSALAGVPMCSVVAESQLWEPMPSKPGDPASTYDPYGWLNAGDTIHRSNFGNGLVSGWLANKIMTSRVAA